MTSICYFGANDDQTIRIRKFFLGNRAVEAVEPNEVTEVAKVNEAAKVSKAWKITFQVLKVIKVLEFNNLRTLF